MDAVQVATAVVVDKLTPTIPDDTPEPIAVLLKRCFEFEADDRPTFHTICEELSTFSTV